MKHSWEIDWSKVDLSRDSRTLADELNTCVLTVNLAKMPFYRRAMIVRHPEYFEPGFFSGGTGVLKKKKKPVRERRSLLDTD